MIHPHLAMQVANGKNKSQDAIIHYATLACSNFNIDSDNESIIKDVADWCFRIQQPSAKLNPGLGLWMYGNIGTGKSLLMQTVIEFISKWWIYSEDEFLGGRNYGYPRTPDLNISSAFKLCLTFAKSGYEVFSPLPKFIDEIGTEPENTKYMGTPINVMQFVFEEMTKEMKNGVFTYVPPIVTTNLSFNQILDRYGERVVDRIGEMFNLVEFRGASYRKSGHIWDSIKR